MSKAILLSGGVDSIALCFWQRPSIALTLDYGQKPALAEISASASVADALGIEHHIISVDCRELGTGDLSNHNALEFSPSPEWWPYRNQLLVTLACMKGIGLGITELMAASVKSDGFHRDGTSAFYEKMNSLMHYQEGHITVTAPAVNISSAELVMLSKVPREILFWAHSCHTSNIPCGNCRGCKKYIEVMTELNLLQDD
jgi:7-cyano-7-deazaguanine synthase